MNAVAGRVWCGYLCPQTVWTDLFQTIERWVEGDRREHLRRDAGPWTVDRVARLGLKHFLWLMVAWWTGGAWVLYFADAPTLVKELRDLAGAADCLHLDRHSHRHDLFVRRPHARTGVSLYVSVATHPGRAHRRIRPQRHLPLRPRRAARVAEKGRDACATAGCRPAIASTACNASTSARPASISATDPISAAFNADCASMPATPSWQRPGARRG